MKRCFEIFHLKEYSFLAKISRWIVILSACVAVYLCVVSRDIQRGRGLAKTAVEGRMPILEGIVDSSFSSLVRETRAGGSLGGKAAYNQSIPIKSQLSFLRREAEMGDMRAACLIAAAFDLCSRHEHGAFVDEYPSSYLSSMSSARAEEFSDNLAYVEARAEEICAGMTVDDMHDRQKMLLSSAVAGYSSSINGFLLSRARGQFTIPSVGFSAQSRAYRENAEKILNDAAEAGEFRAIEAISIAYAMGELETSAGNIEIEMDDTKASAALNVLFMIRENRKARGLPHDLHLDAEIKSGLDGRIASMDQYEMKRFAELSAKYYSAYENLAGAEKAGGDLLRELPEYACEKNRRAVLD